ncbi:hypothetical protein RB195_017805 [Necator americanus]|uniref:PDZ domain-containing protein n=1 Tax=Necator americanus TaxID=51031 RepID=A0ABR1C6V6_NECAM
MSAEIPEDHQRQQEELKPNAEVIEELDNYDKAKKSAVQNEEKVDRKKSKESDKFKGAAADASIIMTEIEEDRKPSDKLRKKQQARKTPSDKSDETSEQKDSCNMSRTDDQHSLPAPAKGSKKQQKSTKMSDSRGKKQTKSPNASSQKLLKTAYSIPEVMESPPKTHLKVVEVHVEAGRPLDLVLSTNLVIRTVSKYSIAFHSVLVGDQILEINDIAPMSVPEFLSIMHAEQSELKLSLLRAWNVYPATEARMAGVKKQDNYSYFIVEVYRIKNFRNGFDVKFINKQCHVTKVETNSRGAHAFLKGDRLLDVDSIPITATTDLKFVRRQFNRTMAKEKKCTFLVERLNSLRSSPNPSCFALQRDASEVEMGDDATEIGCREAMRHQLLHRKYKTTSIYGPISKTDERKEKTEATLCTTEDDEGVRHTKRTKRRMRKASMNNKKITIDTKTETLRMPSDVKDESSLQKVTPHSGLISFEAEVSRPKMQLLCVLIFLYFSKVSNSATMIYRVKVRERVSLDLGPNIVTWGRTRNKGNEFIKHCSAFEKNVRCAQFVDEKNVPVLPATEAHVNENGTLDIGSFRATDVGEYFSPDELERVHFNKDGTFWALPRSRISVVLE